jgi:eukaryotic-like serine/threonine-protein kinase
MPRDAVSTGQPGVGGLRAGLVVGGRYELLHKLADGGMGTVWAARHRTLGCELALKFLAVELSDGAPAPSGVARGAAPAPSGGAAPGPSKAAEALAQFEREARAAARLGALTDYVVRVFDFGVDSGFPFIAMELLEGENLGARLTRRGTLTPGEVARIAAQVAGALEKAHQNRLVHRDLSPENVFLVCRDDAEQVKLLDFGLVELLDPGGAARIAQPMGTLHYMAPELLVSHRIDHRADLWSFAVVLYHAVTGALPFDAENLGDLVMEICNRPVRAPSSLAPELGATMDAFFERALRRDPDARYQRAIEMARAFADAARVSWRPPPSLPPPPTPCVSPAAYEPLPDSARRLLLDAPRLPTF